MNLNFEKMGGLVPAIIQDARTKNVLMLGFMNKEAFEKTQATGLVTFYSRTRNCLWTKGEESGNTLTVVSIADDCDNDTTMALNFSTICRNSSSAVMRRCQRDPTPLRFSKRVLTAWLRKWARRLWKRSSRLQTEPTTVWSMRLPT